MNTGLALGLIVLNAALCGYRIARDDWGWAIFSGAVVLFCIFVEWTEIEELRAR